MKLERLFNVLVVGGAAIGLAACGNDASGSGGEGGASGQSSSTGSNGSGGSGGLGGSGGGGGAGATSGSGGGGGSATSGSGSSGGGNLQCSDPPGPADPCGCPCCWNGCLNTEPGCAGFCAAGNNGAGCCGG